MPPNALETPVIAILGDPGDLDGRKRIPALFGFYHQDRPRGDSSHR
jgi:hypothetical protein